MKLEAISNLYKNAVSISEIDGVILALDANGAECAIDQSLVAAEIVRLKAEYAAKEYRRQRVTEYPPIGDQLDALWKGGDAAAEMLATVMAVKAKYPKPE